MMALRINRDDRKDKRRESSAESGQTFIHGALILTVGMALVKIIGALFKLPLEAHIGEYGMGLFNVAYNFYGPIHSLATAGLPIAISRMVSECNSQGRYGDIRKIKRVAAPIFWTLGILGTAVMLIFAPAYCRNIIKNEYAILPMLALAPAVLFGCLGSTYRGYFEGQKNMYPTAVSELIEAASKLAIGLSASVLVSRLLKREFFESGTVMGSTMSGSDEASTAILSVAAAAAILGVTAGSLLSYLYLAIRYKRKGGTVTDEMLRNSPRPRDEKNIARRLLAIAVPVAIGSVTVNISGLIDTTFLQSRIAAIVAESPNIIIEQYRGLIPQSYLSRPETIPNFLFGCFSMAMTVYMLVPTITHAISISALPNITELWIRGNRKDLKAGIETVLRISSLFSFPAGIGISAISIYISRLLYGGDNSSSIVGGILSLLGIAAAFSAITTPISSMLQAVGRADIPVKMLVAAMGIKVAINYSLCGIAEINVYGAAIGTVFCYLFLMVSEIAALNRITAVRLDIKNTVIKPLVSAVLCGFLAYATANVMNEKIALGGRLGALIIVLTAIAVGVVGYTLALLMVNGVNRNDLVLLPRGQKIAKMLEKVKGI